MKLLTVFTAAVFLVVVLALALPLLFKFGAIVLGLCLGIVLGRRLRRSS